MNQAICHRCQGLMHPIDPLDPLDVLRGGEYDHIQAWRCVACGDLVDSVIMENRSRPRKQRSLRQRSTPRQPVFKDPDVEWPIWR